MTIRSILVPVAAIGILGSSLAWSGARKEGDGPIVATAATVVPSAVTSQDSPYAYVGSKKCKICHIKQYKSWQKSDMGLALETLKPGHATEEKEKSHVDTGEDYTTDASCLKCHSTGFGHAGGYAVPDPGDKKAVRQAKSLGCVGCESCHGPGSGYIDVFKEIFRSKRKYDVEELRAVGLARIDESSCTTCHNAECPTINPDDPFDFETKMREGIHDRVPLKQRK